MKCKWPLVFRILLWLAVVGLLLFLGNLPSCFSSCSLAICWHRVWEHTGLSSFEYLSAQAFIQGISLGLCCACNDCFSNLILFTAEVGLIRLIFWGLNELFGEIFLLYILLWKLCFIIWLTWSELSKEFIPMKLSFIGFVRALMLP